MRGFDGGSRSETVVVAGASGAITHIELAAAFAPATIALMVGGTSKEREGSGISASDLQAALDAELSTFIHAVTHDLRSPMANIRGLSKELRLALHDLESLGRAEVDSIDEGQKGRIKAVVSEEIPETLEHIDQSIARMDRVISGMLELSRIATMDVEPSDVDLEEQVATILDSQSSKIESCSCQCDVGSLPKVRTDAIVVRAILRHLIDNALGYLEPARPGRISVTSAVDAEAVSISVADNGRGIAEKDLERVFVPFRRVGTQDTEGEGMGLTLARALARRLDGELVCSSRMGKGSVLTLRLPKRVLGKSGGVPDEPLEEVRAR